MRIRLKVLAAAAAVLLSACETTGPVPAPLTEFKPSIKPSVAWRYGIGASGAYILSPAIAGESVFVVATDGSLARLNVASGKEIWRVSAKAPVSGGLGVGANMVLVGTAKGEVLAFDWTGKPLWKAVVSSEILSAPQPAGEVVVVRSGDNRIFGLDARDGSRRWEYQALSPALTLRANPSVALVENYVAVGLPAGKLIVLNVANGGVVWETVVATPKGDNELERITDIAGQPLIEPGRICAVTFQGRVACYETQKGGQVWARNASSVGSLAADDLSVYLSDDAGALVALDRKTGASVWKQDKLSYRNLSSPAVAGDLVVVGDFEGQVHFLKYEDGSFAARVPTDGSPISAAPRRVGNRVLVQTRNGTLYAIDVRK